MQWLKALFFLRDSAGESGEASAHEWAEFNLPSKDMLETLMAAREDEFAARKSSP